MGTGFFHRSSIAIEIHWCAYKSPRDLVKIQILIQLVWVGSEILQGLPGGSVVINLPANAGDSGLIPGSGRSPGRGHGNPLQYSCLGSPVGYRPWSSRVRYNWAHTQKTDPAFLNSFWLKHAVGLLTLNTKVSITPCLSSLIPRSYHQVFYFSRKWRYV